MGNKGNVFEYMGMSFTGKKKPLRINSILDESKNTFTHIAICKADLSIVRWFDSTSCNYLAYGANSNGKEPIDLCIDQLLPGAPEANKNTMHEILDVLTSEYDTYYSFSLDYRKKFLRKMVALQLEHKKQGTGFVLRDVLLTRFLKQNPKDQPTISLSEIYQEVMDHNKNTYTHVVVQQHMPDELYDLIKKKYISFEKNGEEKTPLDLACEAFRHFTQNFNFIEANKDKFNKVRCCFFMLLNYLKLKHNQTFVQCCDKHVL